MSNKKLLVIIAIFNPNKYFEELLDSLYNQSFNDFDVLITDDSENESINKDSIIDKFKPKGVTIYFQSGPKKGFAKNFLSGLNFGEASYEYYGFCDQDDIWHSKKIETAIKKLEKLSSKNCKLYCSRTKIVDETGSFINFSPKFVKKPNFKNSLVQSIAGGNTMVFDSLLKDTLIKASTNVELISSHDWIAYICATGIDGEIIYDQKPQIDYRQHDNNLIGSNLSFTAFLRRLSLLFKGQFKEWNAQNMEIVENIFDDLSSSNKRTFVQFKLLKRESRFFKRLKIFRSLKLYRQTLFGNLGLLIAIIFKRI